jgi:ribosomal-protein-alanine N-acetyltransferase
LSSEEIRIHPAGWRDLPTFLKLEKECFGRDAWPWLDMLAALTFASTIRLKAMKDDHCVGFVIGERRSGRTLGWIASICVEANVRRMGVGRSLLQACEEQLGTQRIRLSLRRSNRAAFSLYQTSGYRSVSEWSRYYRDGEDATIMEKQMGRDSER